MEKNIHGLINMRKKKKSTLEETFTLAYQKHKENDFKEAENLYKKILELHPKHFETIFLLGSLSLQTNNLIRAKKLLRNASVINPKHSQTHNNLGIVLKKLGERIEAINCFEKAIETNPKHPQAFNNLGTIHKELGKLIEAKNYYQKAIEIQPNYANAYNNLGIVFKELEEMDKAMNCYKKALEIQSNLAEAHSNLGLIYRELGEHEKSISCYEKAIKCKPKNLANYYSLSELNEEILDSDLQPLIIEIMENINCTKKNKAFSNYLLSKYEKKSKNYKKEIDHLIKGHQHYFENNRKEYQIQNEYFLNQLPKINELNNTKKLNDTSIEVNNEIKPIYIIGVPRCGSTLIERVIASGTKYVPIGEETLIIHSIVEEKLNLKQRLDSNLENFKEKIIEKYKQKRLILEKYDNTFTDKSLSNFFYLALIKKIFNNAKIINCKRNPLSSIMSIFQNNLISIGWTHKLENIFKYFDIYYRIMNNFKKIFPNYIYDVEYERFVCHPEEESKKLMKFCELPWDKKCLEYYKRKDLISQTASNIQIRSAIYKHSLEKYLPYKKFLNQYGEKYSWFN